MYNSVFVFLLHIVVILSVVKVFESIQCHDDFLKAYSCIVRIIGALTAEFRKKNQQLGRFFANVAEERQNFANFQFR